MFPICKRPLTKSIKPKSNPLKIKLQLIMLHFYRKKKTLLLNTSKLLKKKTDVKKALGWLSKAKRKLSKRCMRRLNSML